MEQRIVNVARESGIVAAPRVGLFIMGRKRPGFDPAWGAAVKRAAGDTVQTLFPDAVVPSDNIADEAELQRAVEAARAQGVTAAVLVQPTISDGRLAPLFARLWDGPPVLWSTTEKPDGEMISANSLVGTHVMAATLRQMGVPLEFVYGHPADAQLRSDLQRSVYAVHAVRAARGTKLGLIGYHAPGFVDFHADPLFLHEQLGAQLYHQATYELIERANTFAPEDLGAEIDAFRALGLRVGEGFSAGAGDELAVQARYYRAFRALFAEERFDALTFRCWPDLPTLTGHWPYVALARLVSEGFPIAMEGDVDGAICSRIAESALVGPVYLSDWLEHDRSTAAIWHTGAAPLQLCQSAQDPGAPTLALHFNNRLPAIVQATIRPDMDVTLFRIWRMEGRYHIVTLEGRTTTPRRHLLATNGLFTTDQVDICAWFERQVQRGMPHHLCVVQGHHADLLNRVGRLLKMVLG